MDRCVNCGKAINIMSPDFNSSMSRIFGGNDLCKSCADLPLHQIITVRSNSKREKERQKEQSNRYPEYQIQSVPAPSYPKEIILETKEDIEYQLLLDKKRQMKHNEKIKEIEVINELIIKAINFGVEPHKFDSKNVCIFCKTHLYNILTPKCNIEE